MALFELRTYTVQVGKMAAVAELYGSEGAAALQPYQDKLVGYFLGDVGAMNKLIHLWKFEDDADRRRHWAGLYGNATFMAFAGKLRPMLLSQENQLMTQAPWGPQL